MKADIVANNPSSSLTIFFDDGDDIFFNDTNRSDRFKCRDSLDVDAGNSSSVDFDTSNSTNGTSSVIVSVAAAMSVGEAASTTKSTACSTRGKDGTTMFVRVLKVCQQQW